MGNEEVSPSLAATYISRLPVATGLTRLAVKDVIDVAGIKTTAGSRRVFNLASPADRDAECLQNARAANVAIVGKTNLHELAFGFTGVNHHFGTPLNPLNSNVIPGGSSSGSAVSVAIGDADIAIGTDSAGSVRMPAACCGVFGLKLTNGCVSMAGVWPLAPSLDSIGVLGRNVDAIRIGAELLIGRDLVVKPVNPRIGRVRGLTAHSALDRAVDYALAAAGLMHRDIHVGRWDDAVRAARTLIKYEAWNTNQSLIAHREEAGSSVGSDVMGRLRIGKDVGQSELDDVATIRADFDEELSYIFSEVDALALPAIPITPPGFAAAEMVDLARFTAPVNLLGMPALVIPVPSDDGVASLQLVTPQGQEALQLAIANSIADSVGTPWPGTL